METGLLLSREIIFNEDLLKEAGITGDRISDIIKEASALSETK
jgi:hypothetical protein